MTDRARDVIDALQWLINYYPKWHSEADPCAVMHSAIDLIESLAAELEQVKQERDGLRIMLGQAQSMLETRTRERDAAVEDLNMCCPCEVCARSCQYDKVNPYDECADFMWRGTKEE